MRTLLPEVLRRTQEPFDLQFTDREGTEVDGEALELKTPLAFQIHPLALRLLVPAGNVTVAERRRAREVSAGDVIALARGVDPLADAA